MDASAVGIGVMCAVVLVCLAVQLIGLQVAARRPSFRHVRPEQMKTGVHGGRHLAVGGRSVAPTRDAPVMPTGADAPALPAEAETPTLPTAAPLPAESTAAVPQPRLSPRPAVPPEVRTDLPAPRADQDQPVLNPGDGR